MSFILIGFHALGVYLIDKHINFTLHHIGGIMYQSLELKKFVVPEVVVGEKASELIGQYLINFGAKKTMIVTDTHITKQDWFLSVLNSISESNTPYVIFDEVTPNPREYEAMLGAELFLAENCDTIVAVGGGSVMDCAKCISIVSTNGGHILDYVGVDEIRLPGPPLLCIPTTSGTAADVSQFAIINDSVTHVKKAIISKKVVPDLALIDPVPLMTMDAYLTACTGMDALTHAIEAFVSNAASPLTDVHALKAIELVFCYLPSAVQENRTLEIMHGMLLASMHAGFAFSNASLGAVHALAHSLGGALDLPHGECNSILLEKIIPLNWSAAKERYMVIANVIGLDISHQNENQVLNDLVEQISALRKKINIPEFIRIDQVDKQLLHDMSHSALEDPCMVTNPRVLDYTEVINIYEHLFQTQ